VIHPGGRVEGTVFADDIEVRGLLDGRIRVRHLISIGADGTVIGDVRYGQLALAPGGDLAAEMRNVPPELGGDFEVTVRRGRMVRLTPADLSATDAEDGAERLTYSVSSPEHGYLASTVDPGTPIDTFSQADIAGGSILFVHSGADASEAGFDVVVNDSAGGTSGAPSHVRVLVIDPA
jgi:hypothetical protein